MKTVHLSARLPKDLKKALRLFAAEERLPIGRAVARLLHEGLRMARHPGIDFRWTPTGRKAFVTGTGLAVWEVYRIWLDHRRDIRGIMRNFPGLTAAQVLAGVRYAETHADEVKDDWRQALPEEPLKRWPALELVKV